MKKLFLLFCVVILLTGCSQNIMWNKSGGTQEEFAKDDAQCRYEAKSRSFRPMGAFDNPMLWGLQTGSQEKDLYILCMQSKGYYMENK